MLQSCLGPPYCDVEPLFGATTAFLSLRGPQAREELLLEIFWAFDSGGLVRVK